MLVQMMMKAIGDGGVHNIVIPKQIIGDCKSMGTNIDPTIIKGEMCKTQ
jgi:hypothetical protein